MIAVITSYLPLLLLTLAVELAVVAGAARGNRRREALVACFALNLLTHPLATLLSWRGHADVVSLELLAFLFEWLGYSRLLRIRMVPALRYALLPNLCSALAGIGAWIVLVSG